MTLAKILEAARVALEAQARLALAIREAHAEGESLRAIAEAAGISHEQVRRIVSR